MVRHGVERGARASAVALAWGHVLGPLATEAGVSFWNNMTCLAVRGEEVEEEEDEVYGEEDAVDEKPSD